MERRPRGGYHVAEHGPDGRPKVYTRLVPVGEPDPFAADEETDVAEATT
jgi:hypothetical protein